jgi:hypothetical protein
MAKSKNSANAEKTDKGPGTDKVKSMIPEKESESKQVEEQNDTAPTIRILYQGDCLKLSARGVGELEYELGCDDTTDESYIRISGNASSGAFSTKWVNLNDIQAILEKIKEDSFKATVLQPLYAGNSSSNIGYIAAILRQEGVLASREKQPTSLQIGSWDTLNGKIDKLKKDEVSLTDHIAQAAEEKSKKKKSIKKAEM